MKITYDASQVTYGQLLKVFFSVAHDPTELNRQGPDEGPQYRSSIFYGNEEQNRSRPPTSHKSTRPRCSRSGLRPPSFAARGSSRPGLPSELPEAASDAAVHRLQRPAQTGCVEGAAAGADEARAAEEKGWDEVRKCSMQQRDQPPPPRGSCLAGSGGLRRAGCGPPPDEPYRRDPYRRRSPPGLAPDMRATGTSTRCRAMRSRPTARRRPATCGSVPIFRPRGRRSDQLSGISRCARSDYGQPGQAGSDQDARWGAGDTPGSSISAGVRHGARQSQSHGTRALRLDLRRVPYCMMRCCFRWTTAPARR